MKTPAEYAALAEKALAKGGTDAVAHWYTARAQAFATLAVAAAGVADPEPLTWSIDEAAEQLGVSRRVASELASQGVIPALRLGRTVRVPRAALRNYVEGVAS